MAAPSRTRRDAAPQTPLPKKLTQAALLKWAVPPPAPAGALPLNLYVAPPNDVSPSDAALSGAAPNMFGAIAAKLAAAKTQLDAIPAADFNPLMRSLDLYAGLRRTLRNDFGVAVATNATLKLHELLTQLRLVTPGATVRGFCNAELPGAFIMAAERFVTAGGGRFDWLASSFAPKPGDSALGDAYGLYAAHRDRWLMGPRPNGMPPGAPPVSGDLTDARVVAALAQAVHARFAARGGGRPEPSGASLYTSDAGTGVSADYNNQEELTALLNFGQVVCGLLALAPGGALVTKQYTFFTPFSRSLIALVAALFEETLVVKPLTSRPVNSEVYLVGRGFRGLPPGLGDALLARLALLAASDTKAGRWPALLDPASTAAADAALLSAAEQLFGRQQVAFLDETARLYAGKTAGGFSIEASLRPLARRVQAAWLEANPFEPILVPELGRF